MEDNTKLDGRKNNKGVKGRAGRKELPDLEKKIPVQVYVKGSVIKALGGIEKARKISQKALEGK